MPLSSAARQLAAKAGGFFARTTYHGTRVGTDVFAEFRLPTDASQSVSGSPVGGLGFSLSETPEIAADFAARAAGRDPLPHTGDGGAAILPLKFRAEKVGTIDLIGDETDREIAGAVQDAWEAGYDAIRFRNYTSPGGEKGNFVLVKQPEQIRSVNAQFDPLKRDSANIMAGLGALGTGAETLRRRGPDGPQLIPEEFPAGERAADFLDRYAQTPFGPVLPGISGWLRGIGQQDGTENRLKRAAGGALDLL